MKDTLTSRNHHDFRARYQGTYGYFIDPDNGKRTPVFVSGANANKVTFIDADGRNLFANVDAGIEFEFIPVDRGFFQTIDNHVYYLERVPARQWKRGICFENTKVCLLKENLKLVQPDLLQLISKVAPINCVNSWAAWSTSRPVALSKHFAISTEQRLYFYNKCIGTVDHKEKVIKLANDMLQQELSDLFRRNNMEVSISV